MTEAKINPPPTLDMTGMVFGYLTVVAFSHREAPHSYWNCVCRCGNTTTVTRNNLMKRNSTSCGCRRSRGLKYCPQTGLFYRKGKPILNKTANGYRTVCYLGTNKYAHRLAWEMMYGPIPEHMDVDHINRDRLDNRISNLRVVTRSENLLNRGTQ